MQRIISEVTLGHLLGRVAIHTKKTEGTLGLISSVRISIPCENMNAAQSAG
jgi:hypothetical protein